MGLLFQISISIIPNLLFSNTHRKSHSESTPDAPTSVEIQEAMSNGRKRKPGSLLKRRSRKPRDTLVRSQFVITRMPNNKFQIVCRHCKDSDGNSLYTRFFAVVNVTNLRTHLLGQCSGVTLETKAMLMEGSQKARKIMKLASIQPSTPAVKYAF